MHNVNEPCICEYCTEYPKEIEDRITDLERQLAEAQKALSRRFTATVNVEEKLMRLAKGRDPVPSLQTFMEWAREIGVPDEYKK